MRNHRRLGFTLICLLCLSAMGSIARAEQQESKQYLYWAKFKPGSTATLAGDIDANGSKVQIDLTNTLLEITPDKVVLDTYSTLHIGGEDRKNPAHHRDVPAKEEKKAEIKQLPDEEIEAAGKKFKCKVYEGVDIASGPNSKSKAKVWVSEDVPGGAVKMQLTTEKGTTTFTLKSFEVK